MIRKQLTKFTVFFMLISSPVVWLYLVSYMKQFYPTEFWLKLSVDGLTMFVLFGLFLVSAKTINILHSWRPERVFVHGEYIRKTDDGAVWSILGVYEKEIDAIKAAGTEDFVGPVPLNMAIKREEVSWPGCYYPSRIINKKEEK